MIYVIDNEESKQDFLESYNKKEITQKDGAYLYNGKPANFQFDIQENFGSDRFLYGKNKETNIVNISLKNGVIHVFFKDGTCQQHQYKPWVLSNINASNAIRLKGSQHYKFIKEYDSIEEFNLVKKNIYKYKLYTIRQPAESFMIKNGYTYFKGMTPKQIRLLSFDIETSGLNKHAVDAKVFLITAMYRDDETIVKKVFNVENYETDTDMIHDFCLWTQELDPEVLLGHNIVMFDIPYLTARYGQELPLGRDNTTLETETFDRELRKDGSQSYTYNRINCFGREIVDTFFLAIKADIARKYENYKLKSIIQEEGLEKEGRQHYEAGRIKDNWHIPEERTKIIAYAEDDAEDPIKLWDLMITPFFYVTQYVPKPLQIILESATGSQLNAIMVRAYVQDGYSVAQADESVPFEGALSMGIPGLYRNAQKWDVASLYPSIMLQYNIENSRKDFNHVFQNILQTLRSERLKNKQLAKNGDRYYDDLQNTQKIMINSLYGFLGASGLNYNYPKGAAEVTRHGREILSKAILWATGKDYSYFKEKQNEKS